MKVKGRFSHFMRIVCLVCVMAMILTSCEMLGGIIPGLAPEDPPQDTTGDTNPLQHVECADSNGDHLCDECGRAISECTDLANDGNHNCDECGEKVTTCGDSEKDHICDTDSACTVYNTGDNAHKDSADDKDHVCDYCEGKI